MYRKLHILTFEQNSTKDSNFKEREMDKSPSKKEFNKINNRLYIFIGIYFYEIAKVRCMSERREEKGDFQHLLHIHKVI